MFKSRYNEFEKQEILKERLKEGSSVRSTCEKYHITVQTFYSWQRKFDVKEQQIHSNFEAILTETIGSTPEAENLILRKLYIDLSAHNYKLAQFLKK